MNPALRHQNERPRARHVFADLDLHPVVARDPLVESTPESVQVAAVASHQVFEHFAPLIIPGGGHGVQRAGGMHRQWRWLRCKPLVNEDFRARRVVNNQERDVVEIVGFPQLGGDSDVIDAVARRKLVAADLDPVPSLSGPWQCLVH